MNHRLDEVSGEANKFPVGLRVLVVDDDLCCLGVIETILKKCNFNVTTTIRPLEALKMLREDKNRFDIVIADVSMPEMDGVRFMQLIGIEMGLPVIMMSRHSESKYIKKCIQHGACDYLVKPCQMSELQNIWRHVFKRKHMSKDNKNSPNQLDERGLAPPENLKTCDYSKAGQKRKDRYEEDDNGKIETEDPAITTQKKSRVVWSLELHQKFLEALTHLTIEKAVPKKILDLMNVEGLTRENVASHLQKFRLYLKRLEAANNKQENSMHMRSMEEIEFREAQSSPTIPCSSTPSSGLFSRYNYPMRMNMDEIVPPALIHQNASQKMHNSFGLCKKLPQSQHPELFQGNMRSLEVNHINNLSRFSRPTTFPKNGVGLASSINHEPRYLPNQYVFREVPLKSKSFGIDTRVASDLLGKQEAHLCKFPSRFRSLETRYHRAMPMNNSRLSHSQSPIISSPSKTIAVQNCQPNFLLDISYQEGLLGSVIQNVNCLQRQNGEEHKPFFGHDSNHSTLSVADEIMDYNIMETVNDLDLSRLINQCSDSMVSFGELNADDESLAVLSMNFNPDNSLDMRHDEFLPTHFDRLED